MLKEKLKSNTTLMDIVATIYNLLHRNNLWKYRASVAAKGAFLDNVKFSISGCNNRISIGRMVRMSNCTIYVLGNNCEIKIGGGHTIIGRVSFYCQDDNSSIIIGNDFTMGSGHIASTEGEIINIGDDCMFSDDIEIRNGDSHSIIEDDTHKRINWAKAVHIGNHVWLTAHVRIMKGTEIASNSIVGNSSIVSGKLEMPNSIYAGSPAKLVKSNINWDRNRYKYKKE